MNNKAYFFRDVLDYDSLLVKTKEAEARNYACQKFKVVDTINLEDEEFEVFKSRIFQPCGFLKDVTARLNFSPEGEYLCLAITNENSNAIILVCSFQYPYPRFVATVRRDNYGEKIY